MAQTRAQRARAQRELAKHVSVREGRRSVAKGTLAGINKGRVSEVRREYIAGIMNGTIERPPKNSPEGRSLAALASFASRGKAPRGYEAAFKDYWYHHKKAQPDEDNS